MQIAEPMTLITDYLLALLNAVLAYKLWRSHQQQVSRKLWTLAFAALSLGALLGGSYHGFIDALSQPLAQAMWKFIVLFVGVAAFAMVAGSAHALTSGKLRTFWLGLAALQFSAYALWMLVHSGYVFVIYDTALAMVCLLVLHLISYLRHRDAVSVALLFAIALSVLAAALQYFKVTPHAHFNHNDLYHLVQMLAMWFFYKGASIMHDTFATARKGN